MARARIGMPLSLKHVLKYNTATELYEAEEGGIKYSLTYSQMNELKAYFHGNNSTGPTLSSWYQSLRNSEKKEVKVDGLKEEREDFYGDIDYID